MPQGLCLANGDLSASYFHPTHIYRTAIAARQRGIVVSECRRQSLRDLDSRLGFTTYELRALE